jgi:hypothetical protein
MKRLYVGCIFAAVLAMVQGCASVPLILTSEEKEIRIYRDETHCPLYDYVGMIAASSGVMGLGVEGNEQTTLTKLKRYAHQMGADGVIVRASGYSRRYWHNSGVVHRMVGDAVRNCRSVADETLPEG